MRNINITEKEIDNFMATEEGLAMTEPQYRVIQALLPVTSSDTAEQKRQKEEFVDSVLAGILAGTAFEEAVSISGPYQFGGGDLGWRKLSDIPSMFSDIVPSSLARELRARSSLRRVSIWFIWLIHEASNGLSNKPKSVTS